MSEKFTADAAALEIKQAFSLLDSFKGSIQAT